MMIIIIASRRQWSLLVVVRLGRMSVFAGMPGRLFGRQSAAEVGTTGACIDEWHRCVKRLTVSSRDSQAHHLIEGHEGYWQSAGTQGKVSRLCHWLTLSFAKTKC